MNIWAVVVIIVIILLAWKFRAKSQTVTAVFAVLPAMPMVTPTETFAGDIAGDTAFDDIQTVTGKPSSMSVRSTLSPVYDSPAIPVGMEVSPVTIDISPQPATNTIDVPYSAASPASTTVLVPPRILPPRSAGALDALGPYVQPAPKYLGCYGDTAARRALPIMVPQQTIMQCQQRAIAAGSKYFGMQFPEGSSKGKGQCTYGAGMYDRYGDSKVCQLVDAKGNKLGGIWANAVYKTV